MASEWRWRTLGELTDNFDSIRVPVKEPDRRPGPYPYYGASGIVDHVDSYLYDGEYLLVAEDGENLRTRMTPVAFLARGRFWVNNHAHVIRGNSHADTRFLMYALAAADINGYLSGSAMPKLTQASLNRIPLFAPGLAEQRRIADILSALDDKIELNRRMGQTLESMARALFKSWFVDFDPVRAKAEGRDPDLPSRLSDLFADSFQDSEIGGIPDGWRIRGLDQVADFLNGLAMQRFPPIAERALPVIKIAQLHAGSVEGADQASADIPAGYVVHDGDVLFSWSGSLAVELWCGGPGALNQHLFKVTSEVYPKWFYYFWLREHLGGFREIAAGKATTMGHIQRGHLSVARVPAPPDALIDAASSLIGPLLEAVASAGFSSRQLTTIRDGLLPGLVGGVSMGRSRIGTPASCALGGPS